MSTHSTHSTNPIHSTIISLEDLQDQMELVLDANINIQMTKSYLYSRILDRIKSEDTDNYVNPQFRKNFELIYNYYLPRIKGIKIDSKIVVKSSDKNISVKALDVLQAETDLDEFKEEELLEYIFLNGTDIELTSISQLNGNTFYHDCMKYPNIVRKLIKFDKMNYLIKNKDNLTPLECISDVKVSSLLINKLHQKISKQSNQINILEEKQQMMAYMFSIYIIISYAIHFSF